MLGQPDIIETVVFAPRDLLEDFAVQAVGGLAPLHRVAEVIPKAEAYLSSLLTHLGLLTSWGCPKTLDQICAAPSFQIAGMPPTPPPGCDISAPDRADSTLHPRRARRRYRKTAPET